MRVECSLEIRPGKKVRDIVLTVTLESETVYDARQMVTKMYGHVYTVKQCKVVDGKRGDE